MSNTDDPQIANRPRTIGTVAAVAAGLLAAAGLGAAAIGFTSTLSSPAAPSDPCTTVSAAAAPSSVDGHALRDGVSCAVADSLVQKKVRRDVAQKIATEVLDGRIDLTKMSGPQVMALTSCAVAHAQAAAAAASTSGGGAAAAASAPAAVAADKSCTEAANVTGTR